jgi:hypothetical protein
MSNDLLIAIPSKGRAGLITSQKIFKSAVLFVPESEVSQYSIYSNEIIPVPGSIKGITATRNFILKSTDKDVFFVDDDVKSIGYYERTETKKKMIRVTDEDEIIKVIETMFEICYQTNSKINGFFTTDNAMTNPSFNPFLFNGVCLGSCMGIVNDGSYYFDEDFEVKEDYELTLRHLVDRGISVRSNILFMQHEHTQLKGGCRDSKRIEKEKSAIKKLIKMYPGMIKLAKHRGTAFSIQLNV